MRLPIAPLLLLKVGFSCLKKNFFNIQGPSFTVKLPSKQGWNFSGWRCLLRRLQSSENSFTSNKCVSHENDT